MTESPQTYLISSRSCHISINVTSNKSNKLSFVWKFECKNLFSWSSFIEVIFVSNIYATKKKRINKNDQQLYLDMTKLKFT